MVDARIRSYRDLRIWQEAMTVASECYVVSKDFPRDEIYGMTAQVRRAAVSIAANIAEGHGGESTGSFIQFLRISQGSLKELETHLLLAAKVQLLEASTVASPNSLSARKSYRARRRAGIMKRDHSLFATHHSPNPARSSPIPKASP